MPDIEKADGYLRRRYRDIDIGADSDNKAYAEYVSAAPVTPLGHSSLSLSSSGADLSTAPAEARRAVLVGVGGGFTYTDDGSTPSSSHGIPIPADVIFIYDSLPFAVKLWAASAVDLRVAYYG
jgi:hypothetical protein